MKQKQYNYPIYHSGQYLTSDNLNDSFNFLDEQNRLTRVHLYGYGIISGLEHEMKHDHVVIKAGKAVTHDGFLISFPEDKIIPFSDLMSSVDKKNWNSTILGLRFEMKDERSIKCDLLSCDVNYSKVNILFTPVLFDKTAPLNISYPVLDIQVITHRIQGFLNILDLTVIREKMEAIYKKNRAAVTTALRKIETFLNTEPGKSSPFFSEKERKTFIAAIPEIENMAQIMTEIPQHYLLFLEDVKLAVNEFVEFYNDYVRSYPFFTANTPPEQTLLLGKMYGQTFDEYRSVFRPVLPDGKQIEDQQILKQLFIRIPALIRAFIQNELPRKSRMETRISTNVNNLKLVPVRRSGKLGERAIPYYYIYQEVVDVWGAHRLYPVKETVYQYYTFTDNNYSVNMDDYSYFRLEGFYNLDINLVYNRIQTLINTHDLPINVKKYELKKPSIRKTYLEILKTFQSLSEKELTLLIPKLTEQNLKISLGELKSAQTIARKGSVNEIGRISQVLKELQPSMRNARIASRVTGITGNAKVILDLKQLINLYVDFPNGIEFSGGVYKYKTLILLYFNNKLIATACSPNFE